MDSIVHFPQMATIREAAEKSGLAVYRVRKLVASGQVRYIKAGRRILVNLDSLARYLETGDQPAPIVYSGIHRVIE